MLYKILLGVVSIHTPGTIDKSSIGVEFAVSIFKMVLNNATNSVPSRIPSGVCEVSILSIKKKTMLWEFLKNLGSLKILEPKVYIEQGSNLRLRRESSLNAPP
jgi:hypothetical protein